ncbi:MAG: DNA-binding protein [Planctomycetaceae bacterium]
MARESFLLRTDPKVLDALRRWAEDELRSTNGQLDFLLRRALQDAGRLSGRESSSELPADDSGSADSQAE